MPLYEYQCMSCENKVELMQKFNDPPPVCDLCKPLKTDSVPATKVRYRI
jgi:putative FmdB family regulatory protein